MKKFKKFRRLLTLIILTFLFITSYANEWEGMSFNFISDSTVEICGLDRNYKGELVIPETVNINDNIYTVISIIWDAFNDCGYLTSVVIPKTVINIEIFGPYEFNTISEIKVDRENEYYNSVNGVLFSKDMKKLIKYPRHRNGNSYEIPNSVEDIGDFAFTKPGLKSLSIPSSVKTIGREAIYDFGNVKRLTLCGSIESIGERGISNDDVGVYVFYIDNIYSSDINPHNIDDYSFSDNNYKYSTLHVPVEAVSNYLTAEGWKKFKKIVGVFEVDGLAYGILPEDENCVEVIHALSENHSYEIKIPERINYKGVDYTVTKIGNGAFAGCEELTNVIIPNTITVIGERAFNGCIGLTSVIIPDSVITINEEAFCDCVGLSYLSLGKSLETIKGGSFLRCKNINEIFSYNIDCPVYKFNYPNHQNLFEDEVFARAILHVKSKALNAYKNSYRWNEFVNIVGDINDDCIENNGIYYNIMPDDENKVVLTGIYDTDYFGDFCIPETVEHDGITYTVIAIGSSAFAGCAGLTNVTIPNTVKSIGDNAFEGCDNIKLISFGKLESVNFNQQMRNGEYKSSSIYNLGDKAFNSCHNITDIYSYIIEAPICLNTEVFSETTYSKATLHVLPEALAGYQDAEVWRNFYKIMDDLKTSFINDVECDKNGINVVGKIIENSSRAWITVYDISGTVVYNGCDDCINHLVPGVYIVVKDGNTDRNKVVVGM